MYILLSAIYLRQTYLTSFTPAHPPFDDTLGTSFSAAFHSLNCLWGCGLATGWLLLSRWAALYCMRVCRVCAANSSLGAEAAVIVSIEHWYCTDGVEGGGGRGSDEEG